MGIFTKNQKKKKKTLRQEVEQQVVADLMAGKSVGINDYGNYSDRTKRYSELMKYIDMQENIGLFRIEGLPYHTYQIVQHMYFNGVTAFVKNKIGQVEMCQCVPTSWYKNGYIQKFSVIQPFQNYTLLDPNIEYVNHFNGVLLYDTFNGASRASLSDIIIDDMVDIFQRLQDNLLLSGDRLAFVGVDPLAGGDLKTELTNALKSGEPFIFLQTMFGDKLEGLKTDAKFMELWGCLKQYDIFRQRLHGIGNGANGNDKNERLIVAEVENQSEATDLVDSSRKQIFKEWCTEMCTVLQQNVVVYYKGVQI